MAPFSKLPGVGTTIFSVMSRRARELGALNLGQGFPDYEIDPRLAEEPPHHLVHYLYFSARPAPVRSPSTRPVHP